MATYPRRKTGKERSDENPEGLTGHVWAFRELLTAKFEPI
jgi:hypothetical protein